MCTNIEYPANFNTNFTSKEHAIIFQGKRKVNEITNPKWILEDTVFDVCEKEINYDDRSYIYFDRVKGDSIFLTKSKLKQLNITMSRLLIPASPDNGYGMVNVIVQNSNKFIHIESLKKSDKNNDVLEIVDKLHNKTQIIERNFWNWNNNWVIEASDLSFIMIVHETYDQTYKTYLFDRNLNFIDILRDCSIPTLLINNAFVLNTATQSLWCTNPDSIFTVKNWNSVLSVNERSMYGIEFK